MAKRTCETCTKDFESRKVKAFCSKPCDPSRHKTCAECSKPFTDLSRTKQSKYCSDDCNPGARKDRQKSCAYCGGVFMDTSRKNSQTYCNPTCRRKSKVVRQAAENDSGSPVFLDETTRVCEGCRGQYTPTSANQKYCCVTCRDKTYRDETYLDVPVNFSRQVKCLECGELFFGCIPHGGRSGNHFERDHDMTVSEYQAKHEGALIYCPASVWKQTQKSWTMTPEQLKVRTKLWVDYYQNNRVWNKGLTAEYHPSMQQIADKAKIRLSDPTKNPFYGKTHSAETKELLSQKQSALKKDFVYCRNWIEAKEMAAKLGAHISRPHAVLIQALRDADLWTPYDFEFEKWLTLPGGIPHGIDICTKNPIKLAIEVDGCYYHGCPDHGNYDKLSAYKRLEVDQQKLRDHTLDVAYRKGGWNVLRFWEHDLKADLPSCVNKVASMLNQDTSYAKSYEEVLNNLDADLHMVLAAFEVPDLTLLSNEEVLTYYKVRGFPYPRYSSKDIRADFERLCAYDVSLMQESSDELKVKYQGLGMKASKYFMRNFFDARAKHKRSCVEVFENPTSLMTVIENRRKHAKNGKITDATMRTGLQIRASAPASFPASVAKFVYDRFKVSGRVLDPCAGFGGRMCGAISEGLSYVGVDPWVENVENLTHMAEWIEGDVEIIEAGFEEVSLEGVFDFAFTSPPHYDKELYIDSDTQSIQKYPDRAGWIQNFLGVMIQKTHDVLKSGSYFVLHVSEFKDFDFPTTCEGLMKEAGFEVEDRFYWKFASFLKGSKQTRREPFVVGKKIKI
jgi:very-short-patch-repair endonuclease